MRAEILVRALAFLVALVAAVGLVLPGPSSALAQSGGKTAVGQDLTVTKGEEVNGDAVVTNGNLTVQGEVQGNVVVVNGKAIIEGRVRGNVTVTAGEAELGGTSQVDGNVLVVGGKVVRHEGAQVGGNISAPDASIAQGLTNNIVLPGQPSPPNSFIGQNMPSGLLSSLVYLFGTGMFSLVLLVLGLGLTAIIPRRVSLSSATLEAEPIPSLIIGLITAVLLVPVVGLVSMVLVISIVGWLLLPVLAIAVCVALLFGLVTVSAWIGRAVSDSLHHGQPAPDSHLFVQVLMGMSIILGTTLVPSVLLRGPVTGLMVLLLYFAMCVGIASAILSRFGTLAPPKHAHYYRPVPPATYQPAARFMTSASPGPAPETPTAQPNEHGTPTPTT